MFESIKNFFANLFGDKAQEMIESATGSVTEHIQNAGDMLEQKANEYVPGASDMIQKVTDKVVSHVESASDVVQEHVSNLTDTGTETTDTVVEATDTVVEATDTSKKVVNA